MSLGGSPIFVQSEREAHVKNVRQVGAVRTRDSGDSGGRLRMAGGTDNSQGSGHRDDVRRNRGHRCVDHNPRQQSVAVTL